MAWLTVLKSLARFLAEIAATMRARRLLAAGRAEAIAHSLTEAAHALEQARAAELDLSAELRSHPERLRDDDGFRRD